MLRPRSIYLQMATVVGGKQKAIRGRIIAERFLPSEVRLIVVRALAEAAAKHRKRVRPPAVRLTSSSAFRVVELHGWNRRVVRGHLSIGVRRNRALIKAINHLYDEVDAKVLALISQPGVPANRRADVQ